VGEEIRNLQSVIRNQTMGRVRAIRNLQSVIRNPNGRVCGLCNLQSR
jgi:hypothetical protein